LQSFKDVATKGRGSMNQALSNTLGHISVVLVW